MTAPLIRRLTLEMSLKPFKSLDAQAIRETCRTALETWTKLIDRCDQLAILLWVADGSDILEWSGDLDNRLTAGQWVGFCNLDVPDLYLSEWYGVQRARAYMTTPPPLAYRDLQAMIGHLRQAARDLMGRDISVGMTFDPGPEFAISQFKYEKHPEILFDDYRKRAPMHFVTCQASLHADPSPYGGMPAGIPEGTSMGTFLGAQVGACARDLGYDFVWLSNGFGYSHFAWTQTGELFEEGRFRPEQAQSQREKTNAFWRDFRNAAGDIPVFVRGTNSSVGVDLATDGVSHADIMEIGKLPLAPCNLPILQADALAKDIVTFMTRMARTPGREILYRTYVNDPWFDQNPWFDIYNREPLEFYSALSVSRLSEDGRVDTPTDLSILTIDTETGDLPVDEANEVIPHYLRALSLRADAAGPVVWVYPFDEYDAVLKNRPELLDHVFSHDCFIESAVDGGLPLNTVCGSHALSAMLQSKRLPEATWLAPVPLGDWPWLAGLLEHVARGGKVIFCGPLDTAPPALQQALELSLDPEPLEGDFSVENRLQGDDFAEAMEEELPLRHRAIVSGGGLRAIGDWDNPGMRITAHRDGKRRACAVVRSRPEWNGGQLGWIRGTVPLGIKEGTFSLPRDRADDVARVQDWARHLLAEFGLGILQRRQSVSTEPIRLFIKRYQGAWYFVGSKPDTTVHARVRTDDGAPVFLEYQTPIVAGYGEEHFGKTICNEVRFFVRMSDGVVKAKELAAPPDKQRVLSLTGCVDATVTIYPDPQALREGKVLVIPWQGADRWDGPEGGQRIPFRVDSARDCLIVEKHSGPLYVKW
jgi:hypothetical protein